MNHDSTPDIVVGYSNSPGSVLYNRVGGRNFAEVHWNDGKGIVDEIAFGDFNKDGWLDIVSARDRAPNGIWFNTKLTHPQ